MIEPIELSARETLEYVAELIKSGDAWKGEWSRVAVQLINAGYVTPDGAITADGLSVVNLTTSRVGKLRRAADTLIQQEKK